MSPGPGCRAGVLAMVLVATVLASSRCLGQSDSLAPARPAPSASERATGASANVSARARHTTSSFVSDLGTIVTSPARMSRSDALWTAGAVAATALLLANDEAIFDGLARSRENQVVDAMRDVGGKLEPLGQMVNTLPYWTGAAALATAFHVDPVQALCLDVLESHLIAGAIRNSAKLVAGRKRPSAEEGAYAFWKLGPSLPSGHTSVVFELATIATRRTRRAPLAVRIPMGVATYGLASCVAVERVDSGAHWPSDVLVGAVSGAVIAATVTARNEERRALLVPQLGAAGHPVGWTVRWRF